MMLAALLAVAAISPVTIQPEQLGPMPRDCELEDEQLADGVDLVEVEQFADCLVAYQDTGPDDVARGVALYRLVLGLSRADTAAPPSLGDLRHKIVRAYGINGDVQSVLREAESLGGFLTAAPSMRCEFFDRLAVEFEDWKHVEPAKALVDRFELSSCPRYVPRSGWTGDWQPALYERWFGNQLVSMKEPSLQGPWQSGRFTQRYRLTVLPHDTPGFAARVEQALDGSAVLHWVILDGAGAYDPGSIADRGTTELTSQQVRELTGALKAANLFAMPQQEPPAEGIDPETGERTITICMHGTTWLFELVNEQDRAFVERSCTPEEDVLRDLIEATYALLPTEPFENVED